MPLATCPDRQTWERLIQGDSPADESQALEAHLSSCDRCSAWLSDTFIALQVETKISPAPALSGEYEPIAAELKALWNLHPAPAQPAADLAEYAARFAPLQPGEAGLGRLGHYLVKSLLGKGGMGCVLLAQDTRLSRAVALKIMTPALASDPANKSRFLREAQAVAAIRNDHVVEIHHVDEDRGVPYFVMPLLRGETLLTRLQRVKRLPYANVLSIGREIALGLAAAHGGERKLIHRDIKPANIWLEAGSDRVKLLDFGLALDADIDLKLTEPGSLLGSASYMSPEQARSAREIDERTDLFSLGSVLYEMCTGRMAFKRDGLMNTLNAVTAEHPTPPAEVTYGLPVKLSQLVMRLLAKQPADRPASAAAVAAELESLQRESEREAATPTVIKKPLPKRQAKAVESRPPWRRRPAVAAAAAGLLSAACLLAVIVINVGKEELRIITDESMKVTISEDKQVLIKDVSANTTLRLRPGTHEFEVLIKNSAGLELGRFVTSDYKIVRGGMPVLDIRQEAAKQQISLEPDRAAAEWILAHNGSIGGTLDGNEVNHQSGQTLPAGKYLLSHVQNPAQPVTEMFDRLANTSVQVINLRFLSSLTDDELAHLGDVPKLAVLILNSKKVTDEGLKHLSRLPKLNTLNLGQTGISERALEHLAKFPALADLKINDAPLNDDSLKALSDFPLLIDLQLAETQITDAGLQHLRHCPTLQRLSLGSHTRHGAITDAGLLPLESLKQLRQLQLVTAEITDRGMSRLIASLPDLMNLELHYAQVSDELIPALLEMRHLNKLGLAHTNISVAGVEKIRAAFPQAEVTWTNANHNAATIVLNAGGTVSLRETKSGAVQDVAKVSDLPKSLYALTKISLPGQKWNDLNGLVNTFGAGLYLPAAFAELQVLEFHGAIIKDTDLAQLAPLTGLGELSLANTPLQDAWLTHLGTFTGLRRLDLAGTGLRGSGFKHLAALPELTDLSLACPEFTDVFLPELTKLPRLEKLSLANSAITDAAVETLAKLKRLKKLEVGGTRLTEAGLKQLQTVLPDCEIVVAPASPDRAAAQWLLTKRHGVVGGTLNGLGIQLAAGQSLPPQGDFVLGVINLSAAEIASDELDRLKGLKSLVTVNVVGEGLNEQLLRRLCERLSSCPRVHVMSIAGADIGDEAVEHLFLIPQVDHLTLTGTRITDQGLARLGEMKQLIGLGVTETDITDDGLRHLSGLKHLTYLGIGGTTISDAGLVHLEQLPGLQTVSLWNTSGTDAGVIHLIERLPKLYELSLESTAVTDAFVPALPGALQLRRLSLKKTPITDDAVAVLAKLSALVDLDVTHTKLTADGVARLKAALPNCKINSTP